MALRDWPVEKKDFFIALDVVLYVVLYKGIARADSITGRAASGCSVPPPVPCMATARRGKELLHVCLRDAGRWRFDQEIMSGKANMPCGGLPLLGRLGIVHGRGAVGRRHSVKRMSSAVSLRGRAQAKGVQSTRPCPAAAQGQICFRTKGLGKCFM